MFDWSVVLTTLITMFVAVSIVFLGLAVMSAVKVRKRREELRVVHTELAIGSQVIFAGGLYGRVVAIDEDTVNIELGKGNIVKASRYSIQNLMNGDLKK